MTNGIPVRLPTTNIGFDEAYYLQANPDVATLVQQGVFPSGRAHYEELGRLQGREPLRGGNYGRTLPLGIQRWRQSLGSSGPLVPSEPDEEEDDTFIPTTPAQTPAGGPQRVVDGGGGSGGGGADGYGVDTGGERGTGTSGPSLSSSLGMSPSTFGGVLGSIGSAATGVPGLGALGKAIGTGVEFGEYQNALGKAAETNPELGIGKMGLGAYLSGLVNNLSFGLLGTPLSDASVEASISGTPQPGVPGNPANDPDSYTSAQSTTGGSGPGVGDPGGPAGGFGGGYGGDSPDSGNGDPSGGREANGGHIRKDNRFAAGGLNQAVPQNVAPWDRINVDTDLRGLTSASAYQSSPGDNIYAGYRSGGLTNHVEPSANPVHAALGTQVQGPGTGRSDHIPAYLSNDEYVIPADVVAALGDGSSNAGAKKLRELVVTTRDKYRKKLGRLPPPKE